MKLGVSSISRDFNEVYVESVEAVFSVRNGFGKKRFLTVFSQLLHRHRTDYTDSKIRFCNNIITIYATALCYNTGDYIFAGIFT